MNAFVRSLGPKVKPPLSRPCCKLSARAPAARLAATNALAKRAPTPGPSDAVTATSTASRSGAIRFPSRSAPCQNSICAPFPHSVRNRRDAGTAIFDRTATRTSISGMDAGRLRDRNDEIDILELLEQQQDAQLAGRTRDDATRSPLRRRRLDRLAPGCRHRSRIMLLVAPERPVRQRRAHRRQHGGRRRPCHHRNTQSGRQACAPGRAAQALGIAAPREQAEIGLAQTLPHAPGRIAIEGDRNRQLLEKAPGGARRSSDDLELDRHFLCQVRQVACREQQLRHAAFAARVAVRRRTTRYAYAPSGSSDHAAAARRRRAPPNRSTFPPPAASHPDREQAGEQPILDVDRVRRDQHARDAQNVFDMARQSLVACRHGSGQRSDLGQLLAMPTGERFVQDRRPNRCRE